MKRHTKRAAVTLCVLAVAASLATTAVAKRVVVRHRHQRTVVVVHRGFPIHRRLPAVVVRAPRRPVVVAPAVYLAPVVWAPRVVTLPARDVLLWEDGETLAKDEGWTEVTLGVERRGSALFLETGGRVQASFAEVVFANGEAQVVDFQDKAYKPGIYSLLDFRDGRQVDHVRLVARAKSDEARVTLRLQA